MLTKRGGTYELTGLAPRRSDVQDLSANVPGLARVSHVHAWSLTESRPLVTLEVTAAPGANPETLRRDVKARLASAFKVSHATVEVMSSPE